MNYKFISIIPKSIDQHVEVRLLSRKTTLDERLTTILDDFPEDLIPIISAYVINDQVSFYKQIIDTFLKTHKKAAKTRKRLNSEKIDRLSMYLLYQLLEPDIPDMTRLETYFFEPINILSDIRAGLYNGTGVSARLICGYIRHTSTREYEIGTFVKSIRRKTTEYEMGTFVNSMGGDYLHGQGSREYFNGMRYEGEWKADKRHGQGTAYSSDDGSVIYKGEWQDDKRHGQGIYYWINGARYEGEWNDDKLHGQGTSFRPDGSVLYKGEFKDGKRHGQGTLYRADGSVVYKGEWKDNKQHGQGTSYGADGSEEYRGKWKNDQPEHSRSLTSKISSFFKKNDFIPDE